MILRVTLDIDVPASNKESAEALLRYHLSQVLPNASVRKVGHITWMQRVKEANEAKPA